MRSLTPGPSPQATRDALEYIIGMEWRRYRGLQATARRWAHDPEGWGSLNAQVLRRVRAELRELLRMRRDVRRQVEVIEEWAEPSFRYDDEPRPEPRWTAETAIWERE